MLYRKSLETYNQRSGLKNPHSWYMLVYVLIWSRKILWNSLVVLFWILLVFVLGSVNLDLDPLIIWLLIVLYIYLQFTAEIHCVRMKSSTQQKVSQLVQNCKYLPEILSPTTVAIFTRVSKAIWKYSWNCQIYERLRWNTEKLKFPTKALSTLWRRHRWYTSHRLVQTIKNLVYRRRHNFN